MRLTVPVLICLALCACAKPGCTGCGQLGPVASTIAQCKLDAEALSANGLISKDAIGESVYRCMIGQGYVEVSPACPADQRTQDHCYVQGP
jgi:hypothetical protein